MPDTTVKYFRSTDAGAPQIISGVGTLIGVLDACLVDGYGSVTLSSLVVASGVATATVSTGHGFVNFGGTGVGPVVLIAGSAVTELNGEKRINVTSATTFEFDATGVADGTAGGTITAKIAPAGWEKAYSGTGKAAYRMTDGQSSGRFLHVDNTNAAYALVRGYDSMSDVDTGTNQFPTVAQMTYPYCYTASSSTPRSWWAVATTSAVIFVVDYGNNGSNSNGFFFTDLIDIKSDDVNATLICFSTNTSTTYICQASASYNYAPGLQNGAVGSVAIPKYMPGRRASPSNIAYGETDPPANHGKVRFYPIEVYDGNAANAPYRGLVPLLLGANVAPESTPTYYELSSPSQDLGKVIMTLRTTLSLGNGLALLVAGAVE